MTSIDTSKGLSAGTSHSMTREEFFAGEAKADQMYDQHLAFAKTYQTMTKAELKASSNPWSVMGRMKLSDHEREILAEVAKLNGWSRQATEATYQMYLPVPPKAVPSAISLKTLPHRNQVRFSKAAE